MTVVAIKASASVSRSDYMGCNLFLGWCMTVVAMKASASVSRSDVHGMQPIPWLMVYDCISNEGKC